MFWYWIDDWALLPGSCSSSLMLIFVYNAEFDRQLAVYVSDNGLILRVNHSLRGEL